MNCQEKSLIKFLKRVCTVCFGSVNGGLSVGPYKQVVAVKLISNYSNNKPHDPHGYKEEVKIKYNDVQAVVGKFPNETGAMIELLEAVVPAQHWAYYCGLTPADQLVWEERGNTLTKSMLSLMNLKNNNATKDLHLAYSQGNITVYPTTIKAMARYLST